MPAGEREPFREEAGEEDQPVGDLAGQLEGPGLARRDVDGRLRDRRAQVPSGELPPGDLRVDRLAAPEPAHDVDRVAQRLDLRHRQAELEQRPVADPDPADDAARRELRERAERVRRDRRVPRQRIRHRGADGDPRRRLQGEGRVDVAVARVHRGVGDPEVVEAELLDPGDELDPLGRLVDALEGDAVAHHQTITLRPRTCRALRRSSAVPISASG